jgi:hypothetical protein
MHITKIAISTQGKRMKTKATESSLRPKRMSELIDLSLTSRGIKALSPFDGSSHLENFSILNLIAVKRFINEIQKFK